MSASQDLSPTITGATPEGAASWEDVAVEVTELMAASFEPLARKAADDIYEHLMGTAQDYLADNIRFNLSSRLECAEREAVSLRKRCFDQGVQIAAQARLLGLARDAANYLEISSAYFPRVEIEAALTSQASGEGE